MSWEVVLPLLGVVIGAVLSGGFMFLIQDRTFRFERRKLKDERTLRKLEDLMDAVEEVSLVFYQKYSAISTRFEELTDEIHDDDISLHRVSTNINLYAPELEPLLLKLTNAYNKKWTREWRKLNFAIDEGGDASIEPLDMADIEIQELLKQIKSGVVEITKKKGLV